MDDAVALDRAPPPAYTIIASGQWGPFGMHQRLTSSPRRASVDTSRFFASEGPDIVAA